MSTVTMRAPASVSRPRAASNAARHSRSSSGSSLGTATTGLGGAASRTSEGQSAIPSASGHHAHSAVRQLEVRRENRYTVIGFARWHYAVGADHPERGFDSDDALQARGHAPRARSVGADRDVGLAGGDRDRRSRAGSAADEFGPAAVGHRAVRRAGANQAGRELVEVGLATTTAPADRSAATAAASRAGRYANSERAAVVGSPAASTLSFTASRTPASGPWLPRALPLPRHRACD